MATIQESYAALADQANKAFDEISTKISEATDKIAQLEASLANRELTPEEASALEEAKTALQRLDDIVPDPVPAEPVEEPEV